MEKVEFSWVLWWLVSIAADMVHKGVWSKFSCARNLHTIIYASTPPLLKVLDPPLCMCVCVCHWCVCVRVCVTGVCVCEREREKKRDACIECQVRKLANWQCLNCCNYAFSHVK